MSIVYVLLYIHRDTPENSEVLGAFKNKEHAVTELLERANFRVNNQGFLTQYFRPSYEYESYKVLYDKVMEEMELYDDDIYRITELTCL